jgi:hypothetical protein
MNSRVVEHRGVGIIILFLCIAIFFRGDADEFGEVPIEMGLVGKAAVEGDVAIIVIFDRSPLWILVFIAILTIPSFGQKI